LTEQKVNRDNDRDEQHLVWGMHEILANTEYVETVDGRHHHLKLDHFQAKYTQYPMLGRQVCFRLRIQYFL
jgi:hypothetical protein